MRQGHVILFFLLTIGLVSCRQSLDSKPYGYLRIAIPDTSYSWYAPNGYPYAFRLSNNAETHLVNKTGEDYWLNIHYPAINTTIYCSYKPIHNNLRVLAREAQELIYLHSVVASAIPSQDFANPQENVYGVYYELHGNTASPIQFVLTDSIKHFIRGSVYCNTIPNQDSLAPVHKYMRQDVRILMESMKWQK